MGSLLWKKRDELGNFKGENIPLICEKITIVPDTKKLALITGNLLTLNRWGN